MFTLQSVSLPHPVSRLVVEFLDRAQADPMGNSVSLRRSARFHQPPFRLYALESQPQVHAGLSCGLHLGKDVLPVEQDDGLAGTHFHILPESETRIPGSLHK